MKLRVGKSRSWASHGIFSSSEYSFSPHALFCVQSGLCVIHSELKAETAIQEGHANTNSIAHGKWHMTDKTKRTKTQRLLNNNQTPARNETRQSITGSHTEIILLIPPTTFLQCGTNKSSTSKIEPHLIKFGELWKNKGFFGWHFSISQGSSSRRAEAQRVFLIHFVLNCLGENEHLTILSSGLPSSAVLWYKPVTVHLIGRLKL